MDPRRLLPVGIAVTALLVVAGIASHGRPLRPGVGVGPSATFFDYVATTSLLFAILLAAVFLYALRTERTNKARPRSRFNIVSFVLMIAASVLIASLLASSKFEKRFRAAAQKAQRSAPPQAGAGDRSGKNVKNLRNARIRWDEIAIVLVLIGGIGVYLFMTRDARRSLRPMHERRRDAVSRALDDSIDDLRRDPDIRRAIVAAYARMEAALATVGLARRPSDAPREYLTRLEAALGGGRVPAARLTELFERARFSPHPVGEDLRRDAIGALESLRAELEAPA